MYREMILHFARTPLGCSVPRYMYVTLSAVIIGTMTKFLFPSRAAVWFSLAGTVRRLVRKIQEDHMEQDRETDIGGSDYQRATSTHARAPRAHY